MLKKVLIKLVSEIMKKFIIVVSKLTGISYLDLLPGTGFHAMRYQIHNQRRQEHLASLRLPIHGRSVLEIGCGVGDHTHFFLFRDCKVESTEVRDDNIKIFKRRYPQLKIYKHNMEKPYQNNWQKKYDIIYCYGVLYHLQEPETAIQFMSEKCGSFLLLETVVSYGDEESVNLVSEDQRAQSQSYVGIGCRPTRIWVFNTLKKYFSNVYITITQPNHDQFPTDWTKEPDKPILSRAIFVAAHHPIDNHLLSCDLMDRQFKELL